MYRTFLCEKDLGERLTLQHLLEYVSDHTLSVIPCPCVQVLQQLLKKTPIPDIVLMDIDFAPDTGGIETVKHFFPNDSGVQIIYISKSIDFYAQVYETDHVGFLLKPIQENALKAAIHRALDKIKRSCNSYLLIKIGSEFRRLSLSYLLFVESTGRKLRFYYMDQVYESYLHLKDIAPQLDSRFYQCHKSFIVNLDQVSACDGKSYLLNTGQWIPISSRYRHIAKERFLCHWGHIL